LGSKYLQLGIDADCRYRIAEKRTERTNGPHLNSAIQISFLLGFHLILSVFNLSRSSVLLLAARPQDEKEGHYDKKQYNKRFSPLAGHNVSFLETRDAFGKNALQTGRIVYAGHSAARITSQAARVADQPGNSFDRLEQDSFFSRLLERRVLRGSTHFEP
jgi:hypothetical protein